MFAFTYEEKKKMASQTAEILREEIGLKGDALQAVTLIPEVDEGNLTLEEVEAQYGPQVSRILHGLNRIQQLYQKNPVIESENFRNLLLSFAEDMRVILIMIADRVNLMRQIRDTENVEAKLEVSQEAAYLYAPLAHKLGLYKLKSELEDLSLKYLEHDAYYMIREKLSDEGCGHQVPHQGAHEVDPLHLGKDEKAEVRFRGHLRPFCHPHYHRLSGG